MGGGGGGGGDGGGGGAGGAYTASQTTLLYMKRLNKNDPPIFVLLCDTQLGQKALIHFANNVSPDQYAHPCSLI